MIPNKESRYNHISRSVATDTILSLKASPSCCHWEKIGIHHRDGIYTPLFSLKSKLSCGIGEFYDLIPLFQWCKQIGFSIIQLLPLNDTGEDTSPYNAISSVALNPLFISLYALPDIHKVPRIDEKFSLLRSLNDHDSVQYEVIRTIKMSILKDYYAIVGKSAVHNDPLFIEFIEKEEYWLKPYALFRTLKERFRGAPIHQWPKSAISSFNIPSLSLENSESISFFQYIQYLCFQQLSEVKKIADDLQILIKGDIPILISNDSADVWYHRYLFSSSVSVGAPPDLYNKDGQNWRLPLYNWEAMSESHYIWWKTRLHYAENFYSLYRLDHVAGFFRMWVIPNSGKPHFIPEKEEDFLPQGTHTLTELLKSSLMLPIGEDLGDIPHSIREALDSLGICGTKIPRWERNWDGDGSFKNPKSYSPISLTSFSTHDSEPLQLWWMKNPSEAQEYAEAINIPYSKKLSTEMQLNILSSTHYSSSILHINLLNDYLSLEPSFISKNPEKERINIPGTISNKNWVYRCKPYLEDLLENKSFNTMLSNLLPRDLS